MVNLFRLVDAVLVPGEDVALPRQDAEQLQRGLVLVGLGIDLDLAQHRRGFREVGGDEVLAGTSPSRLPRAVLAVQRDPFLLALRQTGSDPTGQGLFDGLHVEDPEEHGEGDLVGVLPCVKPRACAKGKPWSRPYCAMAC